MSKCDKSVVLVFVLLHCVPKNDPRHYRL